MCGEKSPSISKIAVSRTRAGFHLAGGTGQIAVLDDEGKFVRMIGERPTPRRGRRSRTARNRLIIVDNKAWRLCLFAGFLFA